MQRAARPEVKNRLLAALPQQDYQRLIRHLEPVSLALGQVLYEPGSPIRHVYFPENGVISLLAVVGPDKAAEVAVVGSEGVVGSSAILGLNVSQLRAVVQGEGTALRIESSRLRKELGTHGEWFRELFRFTNALMSQAAQTAACNRFHTVEARLARWLLATRDRTNSRHLHLTQKFLSIMLGVRRVGITGAAMNLQKLKLITYSRGNIQILDSVRLEAAACSCYGVVKEIYRLSYRK
ncbi:MAG: Crp/Fnr family transcriptional regulator [Burkholderiales bacterium]|nr:Crp/Fnr family transcriptional regulator [Burkholderiales bacterium]